MARGARRPANAEAPAAPPPRLVTSGVLLAVLGPYVFFSLVSDDALRESKVVVMAVGVAMALFGMGAISVRLPRAARVLLTMLGGAFALAAVSGLAAWRIVDPMILVPVVSALALFVIGMSDAGERLATPVLAGLAVAGVFTGLLAALQRFTGFWRLPLTVPDYTNELGQRIVEKRFYSAALIGNPGDVGMALVLPVLILWAAAFSKSAPRRLRLVALLGFLVGMAGLLATESTASLTAVAAALLVHLLLDFRNRIVPAAIGGCVLVAVASLSGTGARVLEKMKAFRAGQLDVASTQRDIGFLAALEMLRAHPALGIGPGCYENAFIPARITAEERTGRHLVHAAKTSGGHFENAHSDPVTLAAESGVPASLLANGAGFLLLVMLIRGRREAGAERLAVLLAGFGVLTLGNFPLRVAVTLGPIAFLSGLALRALGPGDPSWAVTKWLARGTSLVLLSLGLARAAATYLQAVGEDELRAAAVTTGEERSALLRDARSDLQESVRLRPRKPMTWIALGSTERLRGDLEAARRAMRRSFDLEERAETDANLGRLELLGGKAAAASALYARACWIFPDLLERSGAVPPEADPAGIEREIKEAEAALSKGGRAPSLPPGYVSRF